MRDFNASASDPDASRHTEGAFERPTEVTDADVQRRREVLDDDLAGKVGIDVRRKSSRLPRRETAALDLSRDSIAGLPGNPRFRMSVKQRYGAGNICSGAVAVAVPCTTRGLDELSSHDQ